MSCLNSLGLSSQICLGDSLLTLQRTARTRLVCVVASIITLMNFRVGHCAMPRVTGTSLSRTLEERLGTSLIVCLAKSFSNLVPYFPASAKFVYGNDIVVVSNPTGEYKDFIKAIATFFEVMSRTVAELPFYKLYNNKLARMIKDCSTVS